jgi:ATP-dependent DNA ligase
MDLPVNPPVFPMLAKPVRTLPEGKGWIFEPKWDGFRALIFRDRDEVFIQSRDARPLNRYYPELIKPLQAQLPQRCVLDGEIVVVGARGLDFEALQMRLHPAASRVNLLAKQIPASIVFFDLLCEGDRNLQGSPFRERRAALESMLERARPPIHLTPATRDFAKAGDWFRRFEGAGLDGVIAKLESGIYEPNRRVMLKVKHERECDCVVGGFRWHKRGHNTSLGSLLLGLYDKDEQLQHVGVCASFTDAARKDLVEHLAPYRMATLEGHPWKDWAMTEVADATGQRRPGASSRWSQGKDLSWQPLRPVLVAQVAYDHMQGSRFRHPAQFRRWRPDKPPVQCTYDQLEVVAPHELAAIFSEAR